MSRGVSPPWDGARDGWWVLTVTTFVSALSALVICFLAPINTFQNVLWPVPCAVKSCMPHAYAELDNCVWMCVDMYM